jgi:hypothetical protein
VPEEEAAALCPTEWTKSCFGYEFVGAGHEQKMMKRRNNENVAKKVGKFWKKQNMNHTRGGIEGISMYHNHTHKKTHKMINLP